MRLAIYQVDSFTQFTFQGNPAGVCITPSELDEGLMKKIAAEMAVSETAFLALDSMKLRWFTPEVEVSLCGHGTLAVVAVMQHLNQVSIGESFCFQTLSGKLNAKVCADYIELDFPAATLNYEANVDLGRLKALGLSLNDVAGFAKFGEKDLIEIHDLDLLTQLTPDFNQLKAATGRGVAVCAKGEGEYDYHARYFAPWVGINEDPVTGSAHCALGIYWAKQLNQTQLKARQGGKRWGEIELNVCGDRVFLRGQARLVLAGELMLDSQ